MPGTLGRLFREQEAREERQRMRREYGVTYEDDGMGSFDDGDPYTTNLYVGNLAPTVDEDVRTLSMPMSHGMCPSNLIGWPLHCACVLAPNQEVMIWQLTLCSWGSFKP